MVFGGSGIGSSGLLNKTRKAFDINKKIPANKSGQVSIYGAGAKAPIDPNKPTFKSLFDYENFLSKMATGSKPSVYAQEQQKLAEKQAQSAYGDIAAGAKSAAGTAANRMAMRGGRGSGVVERLNEQAQQQALEGKQSVYDILSQGRLGIQASDEERKAQALQDLLKIKSGQELGKYQSDVIRHSGGLLGSGGFLGTGL